MNRRTNNPHARRGVALIVVLGILALMMLLGVAFSITMRVERTGAGNYANRVGTRQLVSATLARALEAIDDSMPLSPASTNHMYPGWSVLPSSGVGDTVRLGWGRALDYVQAPLTNAALHTRCTWIDLALTEAVKGRGAFLVINESGFVDANRAGGVWTRLAGETAGELDVASFPSVLNVTNLFTTRTNDFRYETLQEFAALQSGYGLRIDAQPDYFSVYSRAPRGSLRDDFSVFTNLVYLGDHWSNWTNAIRRAEILTALTNSGIAVADAPFVYTNLLDYADEDSVPHDVFSACTEPVPMLNEVKFVNSMRRNSPTECTNVVQARIELMFPFVQASMHTFSVTGSIQTVITRTGGGPPGELVRSRVDIPPTAVGYVPRLPTDPVGGDTVRTRPYRLVTARVGQGVTAGTNDVLRVELSMEAYVIVDGASGSFPAGSVVDAVTNGLSVTIDGLRLLNVGEIARSEPPSMEARDPRYNFHPSDWMAHPTGDSIGTRNHWTDQLFVLAHAQRRRGFDWDEKMYVSNRGTLLSAGELGHCLRSPSVANLFKTIRLCDYVDTPTLPRDRVLEYFTADPATVMRGRVNLNARDRAPLYAVWREIPIDFPESDRHIASAEVIAIVDEVETWRSAPHAFENVADIGALDWRGMSGFGAKSDLEIDSIVAHSARLLTTRHNLFTILLSARPFSMGLGLVADRAGEGDWVGDERAIAQVWRDPFPDAEGRHRFIVQYFRSLGAD